MVDYGKVKGFADWPKLRGELESDILGQIGPLPRERADLQVKILDETQFAGYVRRRVNYFVDDWTRVTAWMFIPDGKDEVPGVLCCHDVVVQGKDETAGVRGNPILAFARRYAEMGYVTIAPDCMTFGERVSQGLQPGDTYAFYKDNPKGSLLGKMLADHIHAIDMLCDTKRVDSARLGVIGHGIGGVNALFLTAFDERVQTCVASCAFTRFADDPDPGRWAREEGLVFIPKLRECIKKKKYVFDWEDVLALCAPSFTLLLTALNDELLPATKSSEEAVKRAKKVYKALGAPNALELNAHMEGRTVTAELLDEADQWFERFM